MRLMPLLLILLFLNFAHAEDIALTSDFTVKKPNITKTKFKLTNQEQIDVENALKNQGRLLISKDLKPVKNDYENDYDRGTVEYNPKIKNYAFHKVIIPDGITIKESNFTQKEPHTLAITGKNLTFIDCNLVNIEKDASWILQGSNNTQIKRVKKSEEDLGNGQKKITISCQAEENGTFKEINTDEEITTDMDSYNLAILRLNK